MKLNFSKDTVKPESLGLPKLKIKSMGEVTYYPRFGLLEDKLIVEFGHYWGYGRYYAQDMIGWKVINCLGLFGGDPNDHSVIDGTEMLKLSLYLKKHKKSIIDRLHSQIIGHF